MYKPNIPSICQPCIERQQSICPHVHTSFRGSFHFAAGEVWDDLTEVCDDCGANLDRLPCMPNPILDNEETFF
jgi:hypothetical protein